MHSVAVLFNDNIGEFEEDGGPLGRRIAHVLKTWSRVESNGYFHAGRVISRDHSTSQQVVVVSGGSGCHIVDANDVSDMALQWMAECLIRHGWRAQRPPRKRKVKSADGPLEKADPPHPVSAQNDYAVK